MKLSTRQWLVIAEDDLATAVAMLRSRRYLWAGFIAQQAAEKSLKAVLQEISPAAPPRIHDLVELGRRAGLADGPLLARLEVLKAYYIATRYPENRERVQQSTTRTLTVELVQTAKEILTWAQQRLT